MSDGNKVVIIGAGLGGISAAVYLAEAGYEVVIIEKNDHIGGKLNELEVEGFTFDLGPSIVTMPHIFEDLFETAGEDINDYVEMKKLDPQWRCFFEDDSVIDLKENIEDMEQNTALSKSDISDLKEFMDYSRELYETTRPGYFEKGVDNLKEVIKFYGIKDLLFGFDYFSTMHQGVTKHIKNPYLVNIMDYFVKYVGSSAYDAPAVLNLLPYIQNEFGLWYIEEGLYNIARGLEAILEKLDVKIMKKKEVSELVKDDERIEYAKLKDGSFIKGDIFISNMEVIPAYDKLLNESDEFLDKYEDFEPACSGLVIHLGLDREYPQLAHHNFFFSGNSKKNFDTVFNKYELPQDPTIYLVATTRTDKSQAPSGCENIKILPHIPHIQDDPFTSKDYKQLRERVLEKLESMGLENLREHIVVEDIWRPEDIKEMYKSNKGAIYGVVSDKQKNRGFKAPKQSKNYDNLYFVGGSVNPGGGMPMVLLSGKQVSQMVQRE